MEAGPVTLTDQEVRERFSAYRDGELGADETAVVRARLTESTELRSEYERFEKLMGALGGVSERGAGGASAGAAHGEREKPVDLLAGVQNRLHKRSKGRFYKSAFSRRVGVFPMEILAGVVLLVLVLAYVAMRMVSVSAP